MLTGYAIDWSQFRGVVPTIDLSLDVDDLYSDADALLVRVRPIGDPPEGLMAVSVDVESGEERRRRQLTRRDDGWHEAELGPLPEGVYRVTVFGAGAVDPATDLVTVLAD
jgi:hypothetical protein